MGLDHGSPPFVGVWTYTFLAPTIWSAQ